MYKLQEEIIGGIYMINKDTIGEISSLTIPKQETYIDLINKLQTENDELRAMLQEYYRRWNNYTEVNKRLLQLEDYKADAEADERTELEGSSNEDE
jgi:hypothetical protein